MSKKAAELIKKGEVVVVIGPSGSGKSTLLHILGGVDKPTSGKVYMNGNDVYAQNDDQLAVFRRRENAPDLQERKHLAGVVKTAFANRRKQMGKVLGANYGKEKTYAAFEAMQLPLEIRPDRVSPAMFAELTGKLFQ